VVSVMADLNELEAFILAKSYGLLPGHSVGPSRARRVNTGKFEPDRKPTGNKRCMTLAHFSGKTNIIIQYVPDELVPG